MHRPLWAAALAAMLLAPASLIVAGTPEALDRARALLARDDARSAAELLEAALPASAPADRPALLQELRTAYDRAARQAEAAGQTRLAQTYRENLQILARKPAPARPAAAQAQVVELPASSPAPAAVPAPLPVREVEPGPTPAAAADDASVSKAAAAPDGLAPRPAPLESAAPAATSPAPLPAPEAAAPAADVKAGDAAFRAKKYDEAGRIYGALAQANQLPRERRDHWAYCRCAEVVRRINANPRTPAEWSSIHAEIQSIRTLSPNMWYGEYLRNLAAERAGTAGMSPPGGAAPAPATGAATSGNPGPKPTALPGPSAAREMPRRSDPGAIIIRGADPEEEPAAPAPAPAPAPAAAPAPAPAPAQAPAPARTPTPVQKASTSSRSAPAFRTQTEPAVGNWQVLSTPNFRILHSDLALAHRVARAAEVAREEQCRRWMGPNPPAPWSPRCDIYIYPTAALFSKMTGQPENSPGFSTMGINGNRVIARRVNLRADHPNLVHAILPHEVTHVVLADLFPAQQIPRWADEGMAVLAEPVSEQQLRANDLAGPLSAGRVFRMQDLMSTDYPDGKYWGLYYAQSVSLTRFLVEQGTPEQFIKFLQTAQRSNVEAQLRQIYKIDGYADLHKRWTAYARSNSNVATAIRDNTGRRTE